MKRLTADIRQQIQAYHQISEDFEAMWSRLSDLARHPQFKSVTARVNSAFRASSQAERVENLQKLSAQMSQDEQLIAYGYLKWFQEASALDKRFASLDERQGNLRKRAQDVRVRGAVLLASGVSPAQQAYYIALAKVLSEEIEDLTTTGDELERQLKKDR